VNSLRTFPMAIMKLSTEKRSFLEQLSNTFAIQGIQWEIAMAVELVSWTDGVVLCQYVKLPRVVRNHQIFQMESPRKVPDWSTAIMKGLSTSARITTEWRVGRTKPV
ncbi:hypothetical protein, partial [Acinetobacter baumannii]|uniref:hypothetical protein n=1 Tax=Acinetobacter baumannii TaxID=470 RepID=UPI001D0D5C91